MDTFDDSVQQACDSDFQPMHPGEYLREFIMEGRNLGVSDMADRLKVGERDLRPLVNGKSGLTDEIASSLEREFGGHAQTMRKMQADFDAHQRQGSQTETPAEPVPA
ncbi:MAG: HigA family addiction module antitoxin [Hyphomicrobiaceae bacterium]